MIPTHCRHTAYPDPGPSPFPTHCKAGVELASLGCRVLDRPCYRGELSPVECTLHEPWTRAEISAQEAEVQALVQAIGSKQCICGRDLVERGPWLRCPDDDASHNHVHVRACRSEHP